MACVMACHLFCLQRELNENLLQLLVDKVDAELLEAVSLEKTEESIDRPTLINLQ